MNEPVRAVPVGEVIEDEIIENPDEYVNFEGVENKEVARALLNSGVRESIISRLPDSWTKAEIDTFINTYYGKLPEEVTNVEAEGVDEEVAELVEEAAESALAVSVQSRKGLTLDTRIIVDGRSVTVRSIAEAGQLMPVKTIVTEGPRRNPRRAVLYAARILDRPRTLILTEETYKFLSDSYPNVLPHDEPLSAQAVKNIQSKTTVLTADNMERVLPS